MGAKKNYNDILKNRNLKVTKHRYAILESLEKSKLPVSAESLYIELKKKGISISLSTVYRSLEALYKKGIVIKSILPDYNKAVFEYNHNEHRHHMICIKCHKMQPVTGCPLEEYEKLIESKFNFTVKGHNLEVYGYCDGCESKTED
ncbi:MAG TPA: transcriptional repressor [Clostridiaceae bacterium]|jgi:Fur family ferric uptake transcriptional regulator|nr:transcriptional repressor [Clostridiaceae bacterium]